MNQSDCFYLPPLLRAHSRSSSFLIHHLSPNLREFRSKSKNQRNTRLLPLLSLLLFSAALTLHSADSGASVVVIYNTKVPESKQVADYYAQRRQVPSSQVLGFEL